MKLHRATWYAIHAMAYLADAEGLVASHDIASSRKIPELFLPKILRPLVMARVLLSIPGPNGGYRLAKPVEEITLLEIVEAMEGHVRVDVPFEGGKETATLDRRLQEVCDQMADVIRKMLGKVRFSDLIGKGK